MKFIKRPIIKELYLYSLSFLLSQRIIRYFVYNGFNHVILLHILVSTSFGSLQINYIVTRLFYIRFILTRTFLIHFNIILLMILFRLISLLRNRHESSSLKRIDFFKLSAFLITIKLRHYFIRFLNDSSICTWHYLL